MNSVLGYLPSGSRRLCVEIAYGVRPQFPVDYLTDFELAARTTQIQKFSGRYPRY